MVALQTLQINEISACIQYTVKFVLMRW